MDEWTDEIDEWTDEMDQLDEMDELDGRVDRRWIDETSNFKIQMEEFIEVMDETFKLNIRSLDKMNEIDTR